MEPYLILFGSAILLGFAVAAPLGPTGITAIRQGLAQGSTASFWIGMGAALTDLVYILATYAGLTPLLLHLPWLTPLLYSVGTLVLGRMGFLAVLDALKNPAQLDPPDNPNLIDKRKAEAYLANGMKTPAANKPANDTNWYRYLILGMTITIVNPATITSWLTIGGAFIAANLLNLSWIVSISIMFGVMLGSALWFTILAILVSITRRYVSRIPWLIRAVGLISGVILLLFAFTFAWRALTIVFGQIFPNLTF
ncbi:MAG: hypothetical protein EXR62_06875 [Chloroflexi bacterium]|nr:hypothetical protein [Chloroflexota bacterium]